MSDMEWRARTMIRDLYGDYLRWGDRDYLRRARMLSFVVTGRSSYIRRR